MELTHFSVLERMNRRLLSWVGGTFGLPLVFPRKVSIFLINLCRETEKRGHTHNFHALVNTTITATGFQLPCACFPPSITRMYNYEFTSSSFVVHVCFCYISGSSTSEEISMVYCSLFIVSTWCIVDAPPSLYIYVYIYSMREGGNV